MLQRKICHESRAAPDVRVRHCNPAHTPTEQFGTVDNPHVTEGWSLLPRSGVGIDTASTERQEEKVWNTMRETPH